jgi:hypothetical protein
MLWRAPCATLATIHDLAPFHVKGKYDLARMIYGRVFVKWLAKRQNQIIAISKNTANDILNTLAKGTAPQQLRTNNAVSTEDRPKPKAPKPPESLTELWENVFGKKPEAVTQPSENSKRSQASATQRKAKRTKKK